MKRLGSKLSLAWEFIRTRKLWWLSPLIVIFLLLSLIIVMVEGSALAPFIYTLF